MSQKSEFVIPFPRHIGTDLTDPRTAALAHERHLAWARGQGLLVSDEAKRRYIRSGVADCLGHLLPGALGDDLALLMDHAAWFFQPGAINHNDGGRGVYFMDPAGHAMELITVPYGGWTS